MIKNDRQLALTRTRLRELQQHLSHLREQYPDPEEYEFYSEATRDTIDAMKREIREYQLVKSSSTDQILRLWEKRGAFTPKKKSDLSIGELIAMLRMAKGLTQEQLAKRLGLKQANIARYEQRGYSGYTVETLNGIFEELGVKMAFQSVSRRKAA